MRAEISGRPKVQTEDTSLGDVTFSQIFLVWSIVPVGVIIASGIFFFEILFSICQKKAKRTKMKPLKYRTKFYLSIAEIQF